MFEFEEPLNDEDLKELLKIKDDPKAKEKLILHNLRLVYWVALKYKKDDSVGRETDDLFQEGVIGLIKAIGDYEPNKGVFPPYATLHIRGSIMRAMTNDSRVVRYPVHMVGSINKYIKAFNNFEKKHNRDPTLEEKIKITGFKLEKINEIEVLLQNPKSLDEPLRTEGEDLTLMDSIIDNSNPYKEAEDRVFMEQFNRFFENKLSEKEFESIRLFYGIDCPEHTLKEIAEKYNCSIEYIRSQRQKALGHIRSSRFFKMVDDRTSFIKGVDYSQTRVTGGERISPVERLVLQREKIREDLKGEMQNDYRNKQDYYKR